MRWLFLGLSLALLAGCIDREDGRGMVVENGQGEFHDQSSDPQPSAKQETGYDQAQP